uniref:AGC-kinase C-terminal domain-containing protein n=1 Tax=Aegilops tauschii subsp. strangulata TaxID=200361 RepID=A0A453E6Y3_AEGTS
NRFWAIKKEAKLNSKDLSFVGYTYKNFDAVKGLKHADMQRSSSLTRPSIGAIFGSNGMESSREPNGKDTHMHTFSSGDPMSP